MLLSAVILMIVTWMDAFGVNGTGSILTVRRLDVYSLCFAI